VNTIEDEVEDVTLWAVHSGVSGWQCNSERRSKFSASGFVLQIPL